MTCKNTYDATRRANLIVSENGRYVYMPHNTGDLKPWDYIRYRLGKGDRIADAYETAGMYPDTVPEPYLKQCIKDIYLYNHTGQLDPISGEPIDKPYGEWVLSQACQCLNMTDDTGRINLGDGFVVPNIQEQNCIRGKILDESLSIAYYECANDIIPPLESMPEIERKLRNTIQDFYTIIKDAHNNYKAKYGISGTELGSDRILIGDGFTLPSTEECHYLADALFNKGWSLAYAYSVICPGIIPPAEAISCIEGKILSTGSIIMSPTAIGSFANIYDQCHDEYAKSKSKGGNVLIYGLLAVLGIALISGGE